MPISFLSSRGRVLAGRFLGLALANGALFGSAGCGEKFVVANDGSSTGGTSTSSVPTEGLMLWLRADRDVTDTDDAVQLWKDHSDRNHDASQDEVGKRPAIVEDEGRPSIVFDGIDDALDLPDGFSAFDGGLTIFVAAKPSMSSECWSFLHLSNGGEMDDISIGAWQDRFLFEVDQTYIQTEDAVSYGDPVLLTAVLDDTSALFRKNGDGIGAATFTPVRNVVRILSAVGKSSYEGCTNYGGAIAEIIVYARPLESDAIVAIESELRARWL